MVLGCLLPRRQPHLYQLALHPPMSLNPLKIYNREDQVCPYDNVAVGLNHSLQGWNFSAQLQFLSSLSSLFSRFFSPPSGHGWRWQGMTWTLAKRRDPHPPLPLCHCRPSFLGKSLSAGHYLVQSIQYLSGACLFNSRKSFLMLFSDPLCPTHWKWCDSECGRLCFSMMAAAS